MKVRHVAFSPIWGSLQYILDGASEDGWVLSHIVKVNEHQSVLVFMKPDDDLPEESESESVNPPNGSYI